MTIKLTGALIAATLLVGGAAVAQSPATAPGTMGTSSANGAAGTDAARMGAPNSGMSAGTGLSTDMKNRPATTGSTTAPMGATTGGAMGSGTMGSGTTSGTPSR